MASEWIPIPEDKALQPGDTIRLYYTTVGLTYVTATQIALAEAKLKDEPRFDVVNHSYPVDGKFSQEFYFTIRITDPASRPKKPGEVQEAGIITVAVCKVIVLGALGFVLWVSFAGARQLVEAVGEAAEGIGSVGWTSLQIAASLIAVYVVYKYG